MIRVENIVTPSPEQWVSTILGARNPMNSWGRSDSKISDNKFVIGSNDLDLMQRLYKAGTEHRKYLRMITVTMDITAPLYWWKEYDTYKVGTVCNSCSTMHKIHEKKFTLDDFSCEHVAEKDDGRQWVMMDMVLKPTIKYLNEMRELFLETRDKSYWWQMIQLLPSSYNQRRTVQLNYETVFNIIRQREHHKLDEWRKFVDILKELPYVRELMSDDCTRS